MTAPEPLTADQLFRPCLLEGVAFETTAELPDLPGAPGVVGQDRAREAVEFGVGVRSHGYNLYVLGPAGVGKRTVVADIVTARAAGEPGPSDWCYVNNFAQLHRPRALRLPRGQGVGLRTRVQQFAEEVRASIPALFESDEYRNRAEQIDTEVSDRQHEEFQALGQEALVQNIALVHTPGGFSLAPMAKGEVMTPEQFGQLPDEERQRLEASLRALQERLQKVIRAVQHLQKEKRARIKDLGREMCSVTVESHIDDLRDAYSDLPDVLAFLDQMQADILENLDQFRHAPDAEPGPFGPGVDESFFQRYSVNVIVGEDGNADGSPVISEDHPTYPNLLGRVEYQARFGTLVTDFGQIKPGALHRANGGYLLLDAHRLLSQPLSWDGLKRALRTREIRIESLGEAYGMISTATLEPEPIPLDVKVILFGERLLYHLLRAFDPEFGELFSVQADFEDELDRSGEHEAAYAGLLAGIARREGIRPLHRDAVARAIEEAARWTGDGERLSARLEDLTRLLREADHLAVNAGAGVITRIHLEDALDAQRRRAGRTRELVQREILRGDLIIATDGTAVGQVNGLSVAATADDVFAFPTRITATTRLGDGEVVDIQREVHLSGPIHAKGVLILASLLASRYSPDRPVSVSAALVFEQTYGAVDGDSASVAELCALLSSLGGFALDQSLAVTGAVDQHGAVLPIGAVNDKIEGFFDICSGRGLTGRQGVVIPATNVKHLMLRADVVAAVREGRFRVVAVDTIDEAVEVLSGLPAGEPDESGAYPEASANALVATRLAALSSARQAYLQAAMDARRPVDRPEPGGDDGPEPPMVPPEPAP